MLYLRNFILLLFWRCQFLVGWCYFLVRKVTCEESYLCYYCFFYYFYYFIFFFCFVFFVILFSYYFEDVFVWLVCVISLWGKLLVLLLLLLFMFYLFMIVTIVCLCFMFMFYVLCLDNCLPYWWRVVTTVIQFSTRGTVDSENW